MATRPDCSVVKSDQSVLLLRMSGVTIAEWSHNGSCRIWLDGNRDCPKLYQEHYFRHELVPHWPRRADFTQRHDGNETGRWQDGIARWLRDNTGVEVDRSEYFPS